MNDGMFGVTCGNRFDFRLESSDFSMNLHIRFRLSLVHLIKINTTENIDNKLEKDEKMEIMKLVSISII